MLASPVPSVTQVGCEGDAPQQEGWMELSFSGGKVSPVEACCALLLGLRARKLA